MATTLRRRFCKLTVTVRLQVQNNTGRLNAAQFTALVDGWEGAIETLWNGPRGHQHFRCCTVVFDVVTRIGGAAAGGFHQVDVVAGPQTSVAGIGPASRNARWDDLDVGNVAAHETGHLMGLRDEYDYGGPGGAYRNLNPQPAGQPQSIMAQTWGNVAALQSHIDGILEGLNADCPWYCCLLRPFHRLWDLLSDLFRSAVLIRETSNEIRRPDSEEIQVTMTIQEILKLIETGDPEALGQGAARLGERVAKREDGAVEALGRTLAEGSNLERWAAAAALGQSSAGAPALERALGDEDARIRVRAAQSLLGLGSSAGVPRLIEALESDEVMIGHPPELVRDVARQTLVSAAGEELGDDPGAWRQWWMRQGEDLPPTSRR